MSQCMVLRSSQEDQPVFVSLVNGTVVFSQLANLAKESGNEHINSSSMLLKRCHNADINLGGPITKALLVQSLCPDFGRIDVLLLQHNNSLTLCLTNFGTMQQVAASSDMTSAAMIGRHLIVVHFNKPPAVYTYDPASAVFTPNNEWAPPGTIVSVRSFSQTMFGSEVAVALLQGNLICLINSTLETHIIPM